MEPFLYHVYVCDQQKPEGVPSCAAHGCAETIGALRREIGAHGLEDDVQVTTCGSLGLCEHGPNMVVYPEGVWYSGVTAADVPEIVRSHFVENTPVERLARNDPAELRAEMLANRERRQAAMRAKDAAGALPDDLQERIRGYQESRILLTALELDVFTALGDGVAAPGVAARIGTDARATETLLNALAAMGLVTKHESRFRNTPAAARYFAAGSPDSHRPALLHRVNLWTRWSTLTECVRTGTAAKFEELTDRGDEWTEPFIAAMHRNASEGAPAVVRAVDAASVRRMLDVGGGSGAYSIAFAKANPDLRADILDLAGVVPIAQRHIERAGVTDRVRLRVGDLRTGPLGGSAAESYDLVFVSAICHMLSPAENADLAQRAFQALAPGGRIVIQDFILNPDKTAPKSAALFSINMLVGTREGASYSEPEYAGWLGAAGFQEIRRVRLPGPAALIVGNRP